MSSFWDGMTRNLSVILHWLWWSLSSGTPISLGRDKICGLENRYLLSESMHMHLLNHQLTILSQASITDSLSSFPSRWRTSESLDLCDQDEIDWNSFTMALRDASITLRNCEDTLVWVGGDVSGVVSTTNRY